MELSQLSPAEARDRIAAGAVLLDVREPAELALAALPGAIAMPMGEVAQSFENLDPEAELVVLCHHGVRSLRVALFLQSRGFEKVHNLRGGIDAWSRELDESLPRY